jgi:hypothetical protein
MISILSRAGRDTAYLTLGLLTSILAFGVWVAALIVSLTLAVLIIGLPVMIGSAFVIRWTAELDRQNAALVFGRPVRGAYRSHRRPTLWGRLKATLADPQVWRDLAWLIVHSVVGFAFGVLALTLVATTLSLATLPLWYWAIPDGVDFGLWMTDTLPEALGSALLALPAGVITVLVLRGLARFHASLAVELLGPLAHRRHVPEGQERVDLTAL